MDKGTYQLFDGIYHYTMVVGTFDSGDKYWSIIEKGSLNPFNGITLSVVEEPYFDEDSSDHYRYDKPKVKRIRAMAKCGELTVHSTDTFRLINELTILPRGKFNSLNN